jgi:hypothetical protein
MYSKASITTAEAISKLTIHERTEIIRAIMEMDKPITYSNQDFDRQQALGSALHKATKALKTSA